MGKIEISQLAENNSNNNNQRLCRHRFFKSTDETINL